VTTVLTTPRSGTVDRRPLAALCLRWFIVIVASRQVGGALGIALLGAFIAAAPVPGARLAIVVAAAVYLLGFCAALAVRNR
jgi:hypothetical protein